MIHSMFYLSFIFNFNLSLFYVFFVQGYTIILARKVNNNNFSIDICFLNYEWFDKCEIKSDKLIKLNIRLRLHHFSHLVGGIDIIFINYIVFIVFCGIDKYLYLNFILF